MLPGWRSLPELIGEWRNRDFRKQGVAPYSTNRDALKFKPLPLPACVRSVTCCSMWCMGMNDILTSIVWRFCNASPPSFRIFNIYHSEKKYWGLLDKLNYIYIYIWNMWAQCPFCKLDLSGDKKRECIKEKYQFFSQCNSYCWTNYLPLVTGEFRKALSIVNKDLKHEEIVFIMVFYIIGNFHSCTKKYGEWWWKRWQFN